MGIRAVLSQEPDMVVCGEAITGTQALAKALELKPDVMILDIGLPELNGVEVTRRVRGSMSVAVLIVTMHDSDQVVQAALEAGASGYLLKSDVGRALPAALRAILSKSQFVSDRVRAAADLVLPDDEAGKRRRQPERLTSRAKAARGACRRCWRRGEPTKRSRRHSASRRKQWRPIERGSWPSWMCTRCPSWCATRSGTRSSKPSSQLAGRPCRPKLM